MQILQTKIFVYLYGVDKHKKIYLKFTQSLIILIITLFGKLKAFTSCYEPHQTQH